MIFDLLVDPKQYTTVRKAQLMLFPRENGALLGIKRGTMSKLMETLVAYVIASE